MGVNLTFVLKSCGFKYIPSCRGSWPPFPQVGGLGRHGKASSGHGVLVNSTESGCQVWVGLQTNCHVDAPLPGPPSHLADVAQKLLLLVDEGANCPYAYARMNDAMAHTLLSSKGHIGIMTADLPSQKACIHLHQLCMWQLLQCGGWVVCPDRLNGGLELLMFNHKELYLWNVVDVGESSQDPSRMGVDLGNMVHVASSSTIAEDSLGPNFRVTLEKLWLAAAPHSPSQYITSRT